MSLFFDDKVKRGEKRGLAAGFLNLFKGRNQQPTSSYNASAIPLVIGVFNGISDSIAQCPVEITKTINGVDVAQDKVPAWVTRPNGLQTPFEFWEAVAQSMLYHGNAYIFKLKIKGKVTELHVIHPSDVDVEQSVRFGPVIFRVQGIDKELTAEDILHIKAYPDPEGIYGQSPIQRAQGFVDAAYHAQKYSSGLYRNNLNLAGVLESEKEQTPESAARIGQVFYETHRADAEGGSPIGVLGGGMKFKPINLTPEQAQFIESERWNAQKFATLLNVPLYIVDGSSGSWAGTGLQIMNTAYKQRTIQPWVKRIEDAFSTFVLGPAFKMRFNLSVVLRSSEKEMADIHYKTVGRPWMKVNEARKIWGMEPVAEGDQLATQTWFANVDDVEKQAELEQEKTKEEIKNLGDKPSPGGNQ